MNQWMTDKRMDGSIRMDGEYADTQLDNLCFSVHFNDLSLEKM